MTNYEQEQAEYEALMDTPEAARVLWTSWQPLPAAPVAPAFDPDWLPRDIREMALALVDNMGVPIDLPALVGLSVASCCACGRVRVQYTHDWSEAAQLYVLCAMDSGEKKSPVFRKMTDILREWQAEENRRRAVEIEQAEASLAVLQAKRNAAIKRKNDDDARAVAAEIAAFQMPRRLKRFISGNATPESLAETMQNNGGSTSIMDDEGELFDLLAGRYQDLPDLGPYLKGYNGNEPIEMERRSGCIIVEKSNLAVLALTQPYVLQQVFANERMVGKGIVQRFLISCPEPTHEFVEGKPLPAGVVDDYRKAVRRLWDTPEMTLRMSHEAAAVFLAWRRELFDLLQDEWLCMRKNGHVSKLEGQTLRIAGCLHLWEENAGAEISSATIRNAVAMAKYFAVQRLVLMGTESGLTQAGKDVLKWMVDRRQSVYTVREVKHGLRGRKAFRAEGAVDATLDELGKAGYIRREQQKGEGRPSVLVRLHPDLLPQREVSEL